MALPWHPEPTLLGLKIQSVATVDELLRITLSELSETLGAETGSIRLGQITPPTNGNGSASYD